MVEPAYGSRADTPRTALLRLLASGRVDRVECDRLLMLLDDELSTLLWVRYGVRVEGRQWRRRPGRIQK